MSEKKYTIKPMKCLPKETSVLCPLCNKSVTLVEGLYVCQHCGAKQKVTPMGSVYWELPHRTT